MRSSSRRPPRTGSRRWPTASPAMRSRRPASRRARRSSSPRRWTATCRRTRRPWRTSPGCATPSATRSSSLTAGPLASGQSRPRPAGRDPARSSTRSSTLVARPARPAPDPAARPPLIAAGPRCGPCRPPDRRHRRRDAEPIDPSASSATAPPARWASPWPRPRSPAARASRSSRARSSVAAPGRSGDRRSSEPRRRPRWRGAVRAGHDRRPADALVMAAAVADFRPRQPADTKLSRGEGLTLELEPTEDILADAIAAAAPALEPASRPVPVLVGFAAETGSLDRARRQAPPEGRRPARGERRRPRPAPGSARTRTASSILAADGSRDDLPLQSKREVADRHPRPGGRRAGRPRRGSAQTERRHAGDPTDERHLRDHPPPDRRRHRQAPRRRPADRDADCLRLSRRPSSSTRPASRCCSSATRSAGRCSATRTRSRCRWPTCSITPPPWPAARSAPS